MTISILALALAYVFLLALVLLAILRSEIGAVSKMLLAALCLGFYLLHYGALQRYPGWPAAEELPARFELISSYAVEPDLKNDESGGLYLWIRDLDDDNALPRAYRLAYRKRLHREIDDTLRKQQAGERYVGTPVGGGNQRETRIEFEAVRRDTQSHKSESE